MQVPPGDRSLAHDASGLTCLHQSAFLKSTRLAMQGASLPAGVERQCLRNGDLAGRF